MRIFHGILGYLIVVAVIAVIVIVWMTIDRRVNRWLEGSSPRNGWPWAEHAGVKPNDTVILKSRANAAVLHQAIVAWLPPDSWRDTHRAARLREDISLVQARWTVGHTFLQVDVVISSAQDETTVEASLWSWRAVGGVGISTRTYEELRQGLIGVVAGVDPRVELVPVPR